MKSYCSKAEKQISRRFVNDLSHKSKYMAVDPFTCYELTMADVNFVTFEYEEVPMKDGDYVGAAPEDPEHHQACVVTIFKAQTSIPQSHRSRFIECMVKFVKLKKTLTFFETHVLANLADSDYEDTQDLEKRIAKRVAILKRKRAPKTQMEEAKQWLWEMWFNPREIRGEWAIARWVLQTTNANIEQIMSPLRQRINLTLGRDFKWKNGKVGTVNIISTPMYLLHFDDARKSPLPDTIKAEFWTCSGTSRPIQEPKQCQSIRLIKRQNFKSKGDWKGECRLKHNGKHFFTEYTLCRAMEEELDGHIQKILRAPAIFEYAHTRNWDYYLGIDEYRKLKAQQELLDKLKDFEKKLIKQTKDIDKLKEFVQTQENESESDGDDESDSGGSESESEQESVDRDKDKRGKSGGDKNKNKNESEEDDESDSESESESEEVVDKDEDDTESEDEDDTESEP